MLLAVIPWLLYQGLVWQIIDVANCASGPKLFSLVYTFEPKILDYLIPVLKVHDDTHTKKVCGQAILIPSLIWVFLYYDGIFCSDL